MSLASHSTEMEASKLSEETLDRIRTLKPMSPDEWRQVLGVLTDKARESAELHQSYLSALNVRITYDMVNALQSMVRSSTALARKLLVLTWVLVIFTAALLIEPSLKVFHIVSP
jgi:hypothetical protein